MAGISVRRSIALRVIVTEGFKEELRNELQQAADETQRRIDQMEVQSRRLLSGLQGADLTQAMQVRRQLETERQRQTALKEEIQRQMEETAKLELGSEYPRGTIEGVAEINVGDDLLKKLSGSEVVVKDGEVVEIREA
jgi:F0F1-type ATP synthase membrane subunit b/b'